MGIGTRAVSVLAAGLCLVVLGTAGVRVVPALAAARYAAIALAGLLILYWLTPRVALAGRRRGWVGAMLAVAGAFVAGIVLLLAVLMVAARAQEGEDASLRPAASVTSEDGRVRFIVYDRKHTLPWSAAEIGRAHGPFVLVRAHDPCGADQLLLDGYDAIVEGHRLELYKLPAPDYGDRARIDGRPARLAAIAMSLHP